MNSVSLIKIKCIQLNITYDLSAVKNKELIKGCCPFISGKLEKKHDKNEQTSYAENLKMNSYEQSWFNSLLFFILPTTSC